FSSKEVVLTFHVRSVEQMIYYLGEVARRQLTPEYDDIRTISVNYSPERVPMSVFVLREGPPKPGDFLSVNYEGRWFSVPQTTGRTRADLSSDVLSILRQQIALNSSAKSLPQSSAITVVGQ